MGGNETSLNSTSLTFKPLVSSAYVHVTEATPVQTVDISDVLASGKLWKGGRDSNSETFPLARQGLTPRAPQPHAPRGSSRSAGR
jgi:hypothetical protein